MTHLKSWGWRQFSALISVICVISATWGESSHPCAPVRYGGFHNGFLWREHHGIVAFHDFPSGQRWWGKTPSISTPRKVAFTGIVLQDITADTTDVAVSHFPKVTGTALAYWCFLPRPASKRIFAGRCLLSISRRARSKCWRSDSRVAA